MKSSGGTRPKFDWGKIKLARHSDAVDNGMDFNEYFK